MIAVKLAAAEWQILAPAVVYIVAAVSNWLIVGAPMPAE